MKKLGDLESSSAIKTALARLARRGRSANLAVGREGERRRDGAKEAAKRAWDSASCDTGVSPVLAVPARARRPCHPVAASRSPSIHPNVNESRTPTAGPPRKT